MENPEHWNNPDQPEQYYFCESCHMLSFWLQQLNVIAALTNYQLHFTFNYQLHLITS